MHIAVTGATGFLGRYIVNHLTSMGHTCRLWHRPHSDKKGFAAGEDKIEWFLGDLDQPDAAGVLVSGVDAVIHAAWRHPGKGFRGAEGNVVDFVQTNMVGSVRLMQAAREANVKRFVFISTCAVHEAILDDRPLDEAHPLWATHHYGAHKAAIEKFVHSFGLGEKSNICALRPTGIYGMARPVTQSKWYKVVQEVKSGLPIKSSHGGKEVHAADVAKATAILLTADGVAGQCYNCYDMYISDQDVARIARDLTGSDSEIADTNRGPKHQIVTDKIKSLGMKFGGRPLLEKYVAELVNAMS
jgi:nucleoside-diphosphate-sugar epimerase